MPRHGKGTGHSIVTPSYKQKVTLVVLGGQFFVQIDQIVCNCGIDLSVR